MSSNDSFIMRAPSVRAILAGAKTRTTRLVGGLYAEVPRKILPDMDGLPSLAAGLYPAELNQNGAVFAVMPGVRHGLRPGEFSFRCPKVKGTTGLRTVANTSHLGPTVVSRWTITPDKPRRLYVKEAFAYSVKDPDAHNETYDAEHYDIVYRATHEDTGDWTHYEDGQQTAIAPPWRSSLHMPRWAARIWLEVIRVELLRLKDITEEEAVAEGMTFTDYGKDRYRAQRAGWSWGPSTDSGQCMNTARLAFANAFNRIHAGDNWNLKPGISPWDRNDWVWAYTYRRVS